MESYRTVRALAAIKEHMEQGKLEEAYELAERLNQKKIKRVQDLNMIAQVCFRTEHYEEARAINLQIFERTSSRRVLAQLVELSIKLGLPEDAAEYLEQYEAVAPNDPTRLIYRFRILKMLQSPIKEQIAVLEKWKTEEYAERWAYELAKLYHKSADADACVRECNDIILWFGEGKYVEWASVLRAYHTGEVNADTLRQYQEQVVETANPEEGENEDVHPETAEGESEVFDSEVAEDEDNAFETEKECENEDSEPETKVKPAKDVWEKVAEITGESPVSEPECAEALFDDEAVSNALTEAVDEFSAQNTDITPVMPDLSEEPKVAFEEEAIRFMQEYLSSPVLKHMVDLKGDVDSKYQPEEGGVLEAMLYERELRLEDLFGNFARIESIRKQIVRTLDIIFDPLKRGDNLIITGGAASGKTELAKRIVKMLYRFQILSATKVAIVDADKLNKMNIEEKQESLMDCCLIVEHAGELTVESVEKLLALISKFTGRAIVFLEGDRKSINALLRDNAELNRIFNNRIHLPEEYRPAELKGFVFDYLIEKDYEIDVYADEVLEERIRMMLGTKSTNPIRDSIAIGKEGIKNAEKRAAKNLAMMAATGDYENADIMILHREDFI